MFFLAYAVEPTECGAAMFFIQNIVEKENINAVKMKNKYLSLFLEGHLSRLHSRLAKESRMYRKPRKINTSSHFF